MYYYCLGNQLKAYSMVTIYVQGVYTNIKTQYMSRLSEPYVLY